MSTHRPIAVLLVHPTDTAPSPARPNPAFFADLFVNDAESLDAYWHDVSDGAIDLQGTQVFGWRSHGLTRAAFGVLDRADKIRQAVDAFANAQDPAQRVDLRPFDSVAVVGDPADELGSSDIRTFDLQGTAHDLGTSIYDIGTDHRVFGHETGHGFGFDHSFNDSPTPIDPKNDGRAGAYGDAYDIMGGSRVSYSHPRFGMAGPGLNTVMRDIAGWLNPSRVVDGRTSRSAVIHDVNDHAPGHLHVLKVDEFFFEFRMNTAWDRGMVRPAVQVRVHAFDQREHSMLLRIANPVFGPVKYNMYAGDFYQVGDPLDVFKRYMKVTVQSIDANEGSCTLAVEYAAPRPIPQAGPAISIGGVDVDGGGWVIVGGHIHRVPPNNPLREVLAGVGVLAFAQELNDKELRGQVTSAIVTSLQGQLKALK